MRRTLLESTVILGILAFTAMFAYELTAKSPRLVGHPLPGWGDTVRVEHLVSWQQPTKIFPLDKLLHESREAWLYYGMMVGVRKQFPTPYRTTQFKAAFAAPPYAAPQDPALETDKHRNASRG